MDIVIKLTCYKVKDGKIVDEGTFLCTDTIPKKCLRCDCCLRKHNSGVSKNGVRYQTSYCQNCKTYYTLHYNKRQCGNYYQNTDVHGVDVETIMEYYGSDPNEWGSVY